MHIKCIQIKKFIRMGLLIFALHLPTTSISSSSTMKKKKGLRVQRVRPFPQRLSLPHSALVTSSQHPTIHQQSQTVAVFVIWGKHFCHMTMKVKNTSNRPRDVTQDTGLPALMNDSKIMETKNRYKTKTASNSTTTWHTKSYRKVAWQGMHALYTPAWPDRGVAWCWTAELVGPHVHWAPQPAQRGDRGRQSWSPCLLPQTDQDSVHEPGGKEMKVWVWYRCGGMMVTCGSILEGDQAGIWCGWNVVKCSSS